MNIPTDDQIRACIAAWLMCGDTFSSGQREEVSRQYANGFGSFGGVLGVIDYVGHDTWRVTEKGLQFLKNGGK